MRRFVLPALALSLTGCASLYSLDPLIAPAATDFASAQRVEVHLRDYSFEPRTLTLVAGRPIVLAMVNDADGPHSFTAPDFFAAVQIAQAEAPIIANGTVEIAAGQTVELRLIPLAGAYDVECTHFTHSLRGMTGSILVR